MLSTPPSPDVGLSAVGVDAAEVRTAVESEHLTPDERQRLINEHIALDLSMVPAEFVKHARSEGRRLLIEHRVIEAEEH
jgi:hypothetical protein